MKESVKERRLRLWKIRQEQEGYDVSKVKSLEDAENFFKKKNPPRLKTEPKPEPKPEETSKTEPEAEPKPEEASEAEGNEDE